MRDPRRRERVAGPLIWLVIALCVAPVLLSLMGVDLAPPMPGAVEPSAEPAGAFHKLDGPLVHSLLEWSTFCIAVFVLILAWVHFTIRRDTFTLVLAVTVFMAACVDTLHTVAAAGLIRAVAENSDLIPAVWAVGRLFSALVLIVGIAILRGLRPAPAGRTVWLVAGFGLLLGATATVIIAVGAANPRLPQTLFPGAVVPRPLDLVPLLVYLAGGLLVVRPFCRRCRGIFAQAVLLSLAPHLAAQFHMAFGSQALFDTHFHIAHALKVLAYFIPLAGLCLTYVSAFREKKYLAEELSRLIDSSNTPIFATDIRGRITEWNPMAEEVTGYSREAAIGAEALEIFIEERHREDVSQVFQSVLGGAPIANYELPDVRTRHGETLQALISLAPRRSATGEIVGLIGIGQDITDLRQKEADSLQAQRMESVGLLTGGIAHDFNNLLTVIQGNLKMIAEELHGTIDEDLGELLDDAMSAAEDGSSLTKGLLAFARKQELAPRKVHVSELVAELAPRLRRTLGEGVELALELEAGATAHVDAAQLEKSLLDLSLNARDAMPEGGKVILGVRSLFIGSDEAEAYPEVPQGDWVEISMIDDGIGMSPPVVERAFEPFFSTKGVGERPGLGLSIVHGFASQSGGEALLESETGAGTTVTLFFPRFPEGEEVPRPEKARNARTRGSETILVVEDQRRVRRFALRCLRSLGYQTMEAANSTEALEVLHGSVPVDLIFTDIIMPGGISGRELAKIVTEDYPELKVVLTSGYSRGATGEFGAGVGEPCVLRKPYSKEDLASRLRETLDAE